MDGEHEIAFRDNRHGMTHNVETLFRTPEGAYRLQVGWLQEVHSANQLFPVLPVTETRTLTANEALSFFRDDQTKQLAT